MLRIMQGKLHWQTPQYFATVNKQGKLAYNKEGEWWNPSTISLRDKCGASWQNKNIADVVKLANTHDSKSCAVRLVGSTPTIGTKYKNQDAPLKSN